MKKIRLVKLSLALTMILALAALSAKTGPVPPKKGVTAASPAVEVTGKDQSAYWPEAMNRLYATLLRNLHEPNRFYKTRYAWPSPIFMGAYLWDTAFISQAWKVWDVKTAEEINWTILSHAEADGRIPHFSSPFSQSPWTQPPVMAWSVLENYKWSGDREYLARAYPVLKRYNEWLYANRRLPCGLFFWAHPYESGIDNSPRFGSTDEHTVVDMEALAAIDLNSYMVRQNRALAEMATHLGFATDAAGFDAKAGELAALVNSRLWDESTGLYYDLDLNTGKLNGYKTVASLFPLFAGIPDQARAERLRGHIMNPDEFNSLVPIPSVALDDPSFQRDMWRGPVWINTAYLAVAGLENYGYRKEAALMAWKLADGVFRNYAIEGSFYEFYNPTAYGLGELHRKKGNLYKQITLGDKPQDRFAGWTALANTLVVEHLAGVRKNAGKAWLSPNFPDEAAGARIKLTVPADRIELDLTVGENGRTYGVAVKDGIEFKFDLERGQSLALE